MKTRIAGGNATPLKTGDLAIIGMLFGLFTILYLGLHPLPAIAEAFPPASPYLGEIRRDASGKLVVQPAKAAADDPAGLPPSGAARILRVGPQLAVRTIAAAAALARDGDIIEIEAGDYMGAAAVWTQSKLTLRGVGGRPRLIANGASAENKAIWVIRGGDITVENIEFTGARVPDKNGAGIRFERGRLIVRNCHFHDNENGILTGGNADALDIENSEFGHNGAGDGYSHNLYVGAIKKLRVTGSYFHHARVGHLIKSRAAENHILYNRLTDESGGRASYELEFPNGGIAYVIGNIIEQGKATENQNIVSFGAEGYKHPANELYLINNTLIDRRLESGYFLAVKPGFHIVKAYNNLLLGRRPLNTGIDGEFINNPNVDAASFVLADRQDYRIKRESPLHRSYRSPGVAVSGIDLAPTREYVHPATTRPLTTAPTLPGARQTLQPDKTSGG
ncbi:MAG: right-handed parallel beta-helix repeat-containing protein [Rhodocyclaceae bacterium]|nr:right-handed parallel beta-helix repeat-containing protein [Rhodocyclaceae bacterium]